MKGIFLDIETTGLDVKTHSPIDIALKIIDLSSGDLLGEYQSLIKYSMEEWKKSDPASLEVNGYKWEQIQRGVEPNKIYEDIIDLFTKLKILRGNAVFICQNPSFDRAFFNSLIPVYTQEEKNWPYHWLDLASMYWSIYVSQVKNQGESIPKGFNFSKNAIAKAYNIPPEMRPHRAVNGVDHLIQCYRAVVGFDK